MAFAYESLACFSSLYDIACTSLVQVAPDRGRTAGLRNATDAALETGGGVEVSGRQNAAYFELSVQDEGPGLPNTANLFVPFLTTKPGGSGIGLVLSRQIAEAHGGSLALENRQSGPGCQARLRLPL